MVTRFHGLAKTPFKADHLSRHPRERGDPDLRSRWIPAFAGMTAEDNALEQARLRRPARAHQTSRHA